VDVYFNPERFGVNAILGTLAIAIHNVEAILAHEYVHIMDMDCQITLCIVWVVVASLLCRIHINTPAYYHGFISCGACIIMIQSITMFAFLCNAMFNYETHFKSSSSVDYMDMQIDCARQYLHPDNIDSGHGCVVCIPTYSFYPLAHVWCGQDVGNINAYIYIVYFSFVQIAKIIICIIVAIWVNVA